MRCLVPAYWSGETGIGYFATTGNTATESLNGKLALVYDAACWKNALHLQGVHTTDQGETSA
ncbi:DUF481 domain-containing protein [Fontimonas thermophila]|uniref:DUF481 domain-containing protein n=1 Tax=Fontimonas thermophila TaxID=1076937 RepID=UPI0013566897|nr:DUF481 domain-containing protein [Fontimonas thermophila]